MNRRVFLATIIVTAGTSVAASELGKLELITGKKPRNIAPGEVVIAESGANLRLPNNPKDGEVVHFVVESKSLDKPCCIQYEKVRIAADAEPLVLDSIANFKLIYRSQTQNWELA